METYEEIYQDLHTKHKSVWSEKDLRNIAAYIYAKQITEKALQDSDKFLLDALVECAEALELLASIHGSQTQSAALKSDADGYGSLEALDAARNAIDKFKKKI